MATGFPSLLHVISLSLFWLSALVSSINLRVKFQIRNCVFVPILIVFINSFSLNMASFYRFVIMGPPGSGKGTISSRIVQNFNLSYIASGDILRSNIRNETMNGKAAKKFIESGQLVPDQLVTNLVFDQLETFSKCNWLLDGFPRTVKQAESLSKRYNITLAMNLAVPDEVIISRLKGRWLHPSSGRIYNTDFNPPKIPGKDDITGEDLIQRDDDKPDVVLSRLTNYRKGYAPVLDFFREKKILKEFSGKESNEIWPRVKLCLEEILGKPESKM